MRKITYLAVLERSEEGYGVYFPDLPGCISYGKDIEDARKNATEALELHFYGIEKDKEIIPEASQDIDRKDLNEKDIIVAIDIFPDIVRDEMDNRRVKTNVTIPAWLKEIAEDRGVNYSRLLESSLLEYLGIRKKIS